MENLTINTQSRDALVNETSVDLEDETSRLIVDTFGVSVLQDKVDTNRKMLYGIGMILVACGAIFGIMAWLLYAQHQNLTSYAFNMEIKWNGLINRIRESESLLTTVCKSEFGQSSVVCSRNYSLFNNV
ncbi:MAG: hypothetical protein SaTV13_gp1 [Sanya totivirus 13]|nr:MAG: hypothetical protein SaTV13_gp1 [Sanya totivirus 13]